MNSVYAMHLKHINRLYDDSAGISHSFQMHVNVALFSLISFYLKFFLIVVVISVRVRPMLEKIKILESISKK